jgi:hypothetical protein
MNPIHLEGLPSFAAPLDAYHAPPTPREPQRQAKTPAKGSLRDELVSLLIDHPRGLTLEQILTALHAHFGWDGLAQRIPLRCFSSEPSIASSLKLLRKTPWARDKVESLYLFMLRDQKRQGF